MIRPDATTLDLFSWQPTRPVRRFDEGRVRASSLRDQIALAVSSTLKDSALSRDDVAARMADWLGEDVSRPMLDAYASAAKTDHTISFLRLLALIHVTGDLRTLQMAAEMHAHAVVASRYLPWIDVGRAADKKAELDRTFDALRRAARKGCRS